MTISRTQGFTLIEVLIALAVFAVAVSSLSGAMRNNVTNTNYLQDKTLAHWVASNKLVELQAAGTYPPISDRTDKLEYAGREWIVNTKVEKTASELPMRSITVRVGVEADGEPNYFATLSAFLSDTL